MAAGLIAGSALSLGGCAGVSTRSPPPSLTGEALAERVSARDAWMSQFETWSFSGRAAVRKGKQGGNGRIEWTQHDARRYSVSLSAPVTRQSWRLDGDLHSEAGRLEGLDGGPREGEFAEELLREATGWDVPLQQLGRWVRGAPAGEMPVESVAYDAQGRPSRLRQAGWTVRYVAWRAGPAGQPDLPTEIEAESGDARVRLILEEWTFASP
ncbi:MAG: outer membrane lipoprotein LolB [Lysobacter sp.]|nr:outer membrane lipoprotein LolB [Lysobacter sp.]